MQFSKHKQSKIKFSDSIKSLPGFNPQNIKQDGCFAEWNYTLFNTENRSLHAIQRKVFKPKTVYQGEKKRQDMPTDLNFFFLY